MFSLLLLLTTISVLHLSNTETRINTKHFHRIEAQNAAEACMDYGFSELSKRWIEKTNFQNNELETNPLSLPNSYTTFYQNTNVDINSMSVTGGQATDPVWYYINPNDPNNMGDPQAGKQVFARDVIVLAEASVGPSGNQVTAYCSQLLQVRDAPLFSHAVFYNMDLEFHNGSTMTMEGPVHCNSDIYAMTSGNLYFNSTLKAAGDVLHGDLGNSGNQNSSYQGPVRIKDGSGAYRDMYSGSGSKTNNSSYYDSRMTDWASEAENRWDGNVGSKDHEVPTLVPPGISDYAPEDYSTSEVELRNHGYAILEPQLASTHGDYKGAAVQKEKFSYKAGLIVRVNKSSDSYNITYHKINRSEPNNPDSTPIMGVGDVPQEVTLTLDSTAKFAKFEKYKVDPVISSYVRRGRTYYTTTTSILGGFYDQRQQESFDEIIIDIAKLRKLVDDADPNYDNTPWSGSYKVNASGENDWNGVVYVELPVNSAASGRDDKIVVANGGLDTNGLAVKIINGSTIPNPAASSNEGFTFATNGPVYLVGNYNSDGSSSTGSSTATDGSSEAPAAIVSDTITVLSQNWEDNNYSTKSTEDEQNRVAEFTEVSAAFLTGLAPTRSSTEKSGGAHNFPRFLEDWGGVEFRYRGSLVALFESEVNWRPRYSNYGTWYTPPIRNWGFNDMFNAGRYPPGSPVVRDFRKRDFQFLTHEEYETELATLF